MAKATHISAGCNAPVKLVTPTLHATLMEWRGCQRSVFNAKVDEDAYYYRYWRKFSAQKPPQDQQYSQFKNKELTPWLYAVPSEVLRNGAYRYATAKSRFFKGKGGLPTKKRRGHANDTLLLTRELFTLTEFIDSAGNRMAKLHIGKGKFQGGEAIINLKGYPDWQTPTMISLSWNGKTWRAGFSWETDISLPDRDTLIDALLTLSDEELQAITVGCDRNVRDNCLATSDGRMFDYSPEQKKHLAKAEDRKQHYQKRMARQKLGSRRRERTKAQFAKHSRKQADIRKDFAHQTSHTLTSGEAEVIVMEDLKVQNMTKKAGKGKPRRAKSALNRKILGASWGNIARFTSYKAEQRGKVFVAVPSAYSSQECSLCGHTAGDNRKDALFACTKCKTTMHADLNSSKVIKKRGITLLRAGKAGKKPVKRCGIRGDKVSKETPSVGTHEGIGHQTPSGCLSGVVLPERDVRPGDIMSPASVARQGDPCEMSRDTQYWAIALYCTKPPPTGLRPEVAGSSCWF